jgi:hypothetical protein
VPRDKFKQDQLLDLIFEFLGPGKSRLLPGQPGKTFPFGEPLKASVNHSDLVLRQGARIAHSRRIERCDA